MNLLDMIIITAITLMIIRGIFRGFFRETGSLAGVILGIWLANRYQPQMTVYLQKYLPPGPYLPLIGFAFIFVIILLSCNLAGWSLKLVSKKIFFGWADRTLGAGLAVIKGLVLTYLVIVLLTFYLPSKTPLVAQSRLAPLVIRSYQSITGLISPGAYQKIKQKFLQKQDGTSLFPSEKTGAHIG